MAIRQGRFFLLLSGFQYCLPAQSPPRNRIEETGRVRPGAPDSCKGEWKEVIHCRVAFKHTDGKDSNRRGDIHPFSFLVANLERGFA